VIALDRFNGNGHVVRKNPSLAYTLETFAIEHERAVRNYDPQPYAGDAVILRAGRQLEGLVADESMGWKDAILGQLEIVEVPGHAQNILIEPNVTYVAQVLAAQLDKSRQPALSGIEKKLESVPT
jgi:thioesterase domain-containing protein